ncbi:MAG TPA: glyoxylate/hydroxypyruvate reductase A [Rhizomicrobium sp.]|jgi:glyoxylate/hydroxypyruvate reductase A|nr:glyoxylate/hydroxypyruvate reductase A [Rhizomicrobium sp.]
MTTPTLLLVVPLSWAGLWTGPLAQHDLKVLVHGRDDYAPGDIDYVLSFRPPPGFLKTLPNLKAIFSVGAGVDGFLADPEFPKQIPLVRFVNDQLSIEMAQYIVLQVLLFHRAQDAFDKAQREGKWRQAMLARPTDKTRIGVLGLGEIGTMAAERLCDLGFAVAGWSRTPKQVSGVESFAGQDAFKPFLARTDILICLLPLTPDTRHILNKDLFAALPKGAFVINAARGAHQVEADLIAALDSGHLAGAALDVFETEPLPEDNPLWAHPKVRVTPHIAAISDPKITIDMVLDGIARKESGKPLQNVVDPSKGY